MDFQAVGKLCAQLRREQHKTQQTVANDIGVSRATINAFEAGRAGDVGLRKVLKLLSYYGYDIVVQPKSDLPTLEMLLNER